MGGVTFPMFIGDAIKTRRLELKMSQVQLAEAVHVRQSYISAIENGGADITLSTLYKIASALGVTAKDLV